MTLKYIISNPRIKISLNLHEAEFYAAAVVVQPLIGNLVYYSNLGRYEPRLASSWEHINDSTWVFTLKNGFVCENGEVITPESFKKSLERSILYLGKKSKVPVLENLIGYENFIFGNAKEISGIKTDNNKLIFQFNVRVKTGLIEILSFAPFGYISQENLNLDGTWKDNTKFISSGPYKVSEIIIGEKYVLTKRQDWPIVVKKSPERIEITHVVPTIINANDHVILDSLTRLENLPNELTKFSLVPEYINPILFSNLKTGIFSNKKTRILFKKLISYNREKILPKEWDNHYRSSAYYPSQKIDNVSEISDEDIKQLSGDRKDIIIEGTYPQENTSRWYAWLVLKDTLDQINWSYKFSNTIPNKINIADPSADIRIRGQSIGSGVDARGIGVVFCSDLGPKFPDPEGKICELISKYENDFINQDELTKEFLTQVEEDAAIIPISHFGIQMYMTKNINQESISPLISVMRFDDLVLD